MILNQKHSLFPEFDQNFVNSTNKLRFESECSQNTRTVLCAFFVPPPCVQRTLTAIFVNLVFVGHRGGVDTPGPSRLCKFEFAHCDPPPQLTRYHWEDPTF